MALSSVPHYYPTGFDALDLSATLLDTLVDLPMDFDPFLVATPALTAKSSWSGTVGTNSWPSQIAEQAAFPPDGSANVVRTASTPSWSHHTTPPPLTVLSDIRGHREHSAAASDSDLEESLLYTRDAFEYITTLDYHGTLG